MKFNKIISILIVSTILSVFSINSAYGAWTKLSGEGDEQEETQLLRVDTDPDSPLHEQNEGVYGYWHDSDTFVYVLNFSNSQPLYYPYTWDKVVWIPSSIDKQGSCSQ